MCIKYPIIIGKCLSLTKVSPESETGSRLGSRFALIYIHIVRVAASREDGITPTRNKLLLLLVSCLGGKGNGS